MGIIKNIVIGLGLIFIGIPGTLLGWSRFKLLAIVRGGYSKQYTEGDLIVEEWPNGFKKYTKKK